MKHKGSLHEYNNDKAEDLLRAYRQVIASVPSIDIKAVFRKVVDMPSKRFWVSEERALIVIRRMMNGYDLRDMNKTTRAKYAEIHRRVCILLRSKPSMSLSDAVINVVHQKAPSFYLTPDSACVILNRYRCTHRKKR